MKAARAPINDNPAICNKANSPPTNLCDPLDLVNGNCPLGQCVGGYGWMDGNDDDNNGFKDDLFGWDFRGAGDNLPEPDASSGAPFHGTAVAGMLAAIGNNGVDAPGVAWHVRLMLVKGNLISNPAGAASANMSIPDRLSRDSMVRGLVYAHRNGAQVVNLSLGTSITREDAEIGGCENRGIHFVPAAKFSTGLQRLADEWSLQVGSLASQAVLTVAMDDCGGENNDRDGNFFYPAYTTPRPDLGVSFVHPTMITVAAATMWDDFNMQVFSQPHLASFTSVGPNTVLIAAPGDNLRVLDVQAYPPAGVNTSTTDCAALGSDAIHRCGGTSFAAPTVAGAAALVRANNPSLDAAAIKARILDNATTDIFIGNGVQGSRVLRIDAAVGP